MTILRKPWLGAAAMTAAALGLFAPVEEASAQLSTASAQSQTWQANDDDFLFLKLKVKRYQLNFEVRGYQTDRGVCLDLADVIQSLDLPIRIDKKSRRATGWLFAEDQEITIDRDSNTVQNMNTGPVPLAQDIYDTPEGWCVDTKALSQWFGVNFRPNLFNAAVMIESETDLPFMQAIERRKRAERIRPRNIAFDLSKYPNAKMEYRSWREPSVDVVTDIRASSTNGVSSRVEMYAAGEALGVSYNARVGTDNSLQPQSVRVRAYRSSASGGMLGPLDATDIAVGDVETVPGRLVGQTAVGRGGFITNRPLGQNSRFSSTVLRGTLPSGWDAELYRNDQLIAFQSSREDGRYEFLDVDLFFGRNDFEVVLYGPQGQIRREKSSVPVGSNQIEPGQTHYWAGVLQDRRDLVQLRSPNEDLLQKWRWGAGIEHGISKRTSVGFGMHNLFVNEGRYTYAEATLTHGFDFAQVEFATAHEFGGGVLTDIRTLGRFGTVNFGLNARKFFGNFSGEFGSNEIDYLGGFNFSTSLRLGQLSIPVQAGVTHAKRTNGEAIDAFNFTTSFTRGRLSLSANLSHEQDSGRPDADETKLVLLANTRIRKVRLRGNATIRANGPNKGIETVTVRAEGNVGEKGRLQGDLEYNAGGNEFRLTAGYTLDFKKISLRGEAFVTSSGAVGAGFQTAFSFGPNPATGRLRVTGTKLARSGQAAVTVFRDDNGNSRRDADEPLIENVMVEAGLRSTDAITAENGQAIVDELKPFHPVLVGIDESSLDDPFLAPASKGVVITPRPGVMAELELAISPTGEVEGSLLSTNGADQPGVRLQLLDARGGVAAETVSEFDGFFLFQRVPYGEYRLQVGEDAANALKVIQNIALPDGSPTFTLGRDRDVVRYGPVPLQRADDPFEQGPNDRPSDAAEQPPIIAANRSSAAGSGGGNPLTLDESAR